MRCPRCLAAVLGLPLALAAPPAPAQDATWWDVISPDRLAQSFVQYGLVALRTQVELTYDGLSVDILGGRAVLTDLRLVPRPDWDPEGRCVVTVDRVVLASTPPTQIEEILATARVYGLTLGSDCLPPEARAVTGPLGLDRLTLGHLAATMRYDVPSAAADLTVQAVADGLLAADLEIAFDYLSVDGREDMEEPLPVADISAARLVIEDLGAMALARPMLPAGFGDPAQADMAVGGAIGAAIAQANRGAAPAGEADPGADPSALSPEQTAFVESAAAAWAAFLTDPRRLTVESGIPAGESVRFEPDLWESDPRAVFAALRPRVSTVPATASAALPVALLQQALGEDAASLSPGDRLAVGRALVSGTGAPRNVAAGTQILVTLARDGDVAAADALSETLVGTEPVNAYGWGLRAAAAGLPGATARLDRLEREIGLAQALAVQADVSAGAEHPVEALDSVAAIKAEARARLTGRGQPRSYGIAAMWAMLAKAAGDPEGAALLAEIDGIVARGGPEAAEPWAAAESEASRLALDVWIGRNLAAQFGTP